MQPSKRHNYQIRPTNPSYTPYQLLHKSLNQMFQEINKSCDHICKPVIRIKKELGNDKEYKVICLGIQTLRDLEVIMDSEKTYSIEDSIEVLIIRYYDYIKKQKS